MRKVPFKLAHLSLAGATFELEEVHKATNVARVGGLLAAVPLDHSYPPRFYTLEGDPAGDYRGCALVTVLPLVAHKEPFSYERYLELKDKGVKVLTRDGTAIDQLFLFNNVAEDDYPLRGGRGTRVDSWCANGNYYYDHVEVCLDLVALEWEE